MVIASTTIMPTVAIAAKMAEAVEYFLAFSMSDLPASEAAIADTMSVTKVIKPRIARIMVVYIFKIQEKKVEKYKLFPFLKKREKYAGELRSRGLSPFLQTSL